MHFYTEVYLENYIQELNTKILLIKKSFTPFIFIVLYFSFLEIGSSAFLVLLCKLYSGFLFLRINLKVMH